MVFANKKVNHIQKNSAVNFVFKFLVIIMFYDFLQHYSRSSVLGRQRSSGNCVSNTSMVFPPGSGTSYL